MRVGIGQDVHKFAYGRKLVLGGVDIPHEKGLLGHSDADVLTHAAMDALLGAAGMGDIGIYFPDTDEEYKDISSLKLLEKTHDMIRQKGYEISNMDMTVIAQTPKLSPYRSEMIRNLAISLGVHEDRINVKFTTTEGLGFVGKKDGIEAICIVLLMKGRKE